MGLILSALLLSLSANLDNVVIGIAYGIKKIKIGILKNLIIATVTTTGTLLAMLAGNYISTFLPDSLASALGAATFIILGAYFVAQSIAKLSSKKSDDKLECKEELSSKIFASISMKESFIIAVGLTFNNLGTGVVASFAGVSIEFTVIATFLLSLLTIIFGTAVGGHVLGRFFGRYAPLISGALLIVLGIVEFIG